MGKVSHIQANIKLDTSKFPSKKPTLAELKDIIANKKDSDYIVNISNEGKTKLEKEGSYKIAYKVKGITSARETWEDDAARNRVNILSDPFVNEEEIMRLDEPETYARYKELRNKRMDTLTNTENGLTNYTIVNSFDDLSEEGKQYELESQNIFIDWYNRRRLNMSVNPIEPILKKIDELEIQYSDDVHEVTFNMYGGDNPVAENLWRYNSKFNVLLSKKMFTSLVAEDDSEKRDIESFIDECVGKIKETELLYEGNLKHLRFGVKLFDDGTVSYHANFDGCKNAYGITATSAEDLLKELIIYDRH